MIYGPGDVMMVTRLDRLARSIATFLIASPRSPARKPGLDHSLTRERTQPPRLMLTVLGRLAEFERELIRARTGEGRERAKACGQGLGRPFKIAPHQRSEAIRRRDRGETLTGIARSYNVRPSTISRLAG
jgi:DNA invertase Pin-like site-specific DNA recombinase